MKLPAIIKRDTATALTQVQAGLAAAEAKLAQLGESRSALLEAGDIAGARRIDQQVADVFGDVGALKDREAILERKAEAEDRVRAEEQYRQAVDKIAAVLPRRAKAAEGVERAFANLASATKEFMIATESVLKAWPADAEFPPRAYPGHALSLERLGALVRDIFTPSRGHADRRPAQPIEFVTLACDADRHRAFAAIERDLANEWLADLKAAHDPSSVESENEEQAA